LTMMTAKGENMTMERHTSNVYERINRPFHTARV
jgi:hypothetical protein